MSPRIHAMRVGLNRGLIEFRDGLRNPQDLTFYLVVSAGVLSYLYFNRHDQVAGTTLYLPTVVLPSVLGGLVGFGGVIGTAYVLSVEREDGTLLRAKAVPHGMTGYLTAHAVRTVVEAVPSLASVLIPGLILFDGLLQGGSDGLLTVLWLVPLGLLTAVPIGMVIGSLVPGPQKVGTFGMLPLGGLIAISGIFHPFAALPAWLQDVGQAFPLYWLGLGMRSAFLPESAAAAESGGSWRTLEMVGVLGAWAIVGLLVAPAVLRRMARHESGSKVEERRERVLQRIG